MQFARTLRNQASQAVKLAKMNKFDHEKKMLKNLPIFIRPHFDPIPEHDQFKTEKEWKYVPGDKVVYINKGSEYHGNMCTVMKQNAQSNAFQLDHSGPMKKTPTPKNLWAEGQSSYIVPTPHLVKQDQIKLVVEIEDSETQVLKKVVVDDVEFKGSYYDDRYHKIMPIRYVKNENIRVPWPKPDVPEQDDVLGTSTDQVAQQSYWPKSLIQSPIPEAALGDLRSYNSPQQYINKQITPQILRKLTPPKMPKTPVQKARIAERDVLFKQAKERSASFTDSEKEKIGDVIFKHLSKGFTEKAQ